MASWLVHPSPDPAIWVRALGSVSRKPRKLFRPVKPFLVGQKLGSLSLEVWVGGGL